MAFDDVLRQVAETLEKEGNARTVFGEPVKLDTKTIIPVALVQFGGGGGGVSPRGKEGDAPAQGFGAGGGGGFAVQPVGFIHEEDGAVVFTPIHVDVKNKPFLTEAAQGLGRAIDTVTTVVSRRRLGNKVVPAPRPSA